MGAFFITLAACATTPSPGSDIGRSSAVPEPEESPAAADDAPLEPTAENEASEPDDAALEAAALEVPEFGASVVVLPSASARPAPVLVAAHGAGDSPEWQCEHWGAVARGRYFVLCPRGLSLGASGGFYYANHFALEKELVAALDAVRKTYGGMVRPDGGVYTGYSQGATMGALMIIEHGSEFPYLVLVEGGFSEWSLGRAKRYAATGGKSVALVCGGTGCMNRAKTAAKILERAGLRARADLAEGGGHTYVGIVGDRATELFENWLLTDEP
jgi:predicted esterase